MENKNKNAVVIIIMLVAALSIGTMIVGTLDNAHASSKNARSNDQQNSCGNDDLTINIICQNNSSKDRQK
jgi:hypothetical protein